MSQFKILNSHGNKHVICDNLFESMNDVIRCTMEKLEYASNNIYNLKASTKINELIKLKETTDDFLDRADELQNNLTSVKKDIHHDYSSIDKLKNSVDELHTNYQQTQSNMTQKNYDTHQLINKLNALLKDIDKINQIFMDINNNPSLENHVSEQKEIVNKLQIILDNKQTTVKSIQEQINYCQTNIISLQQTFEILEKDISEMNICTKYIQNNSHDISNNLKIIKKSQNISPINNIQINLNLGINDMTQYEKYQKIYTHQFNTIFNNNPFVFSSVYTSNYKLTVPKINKYELTLEISCDFNSNISIIQDDTKISFITPIYFNNSQYLLYMDNNKLYLLNSIDIYEHKWNYPILLNNNIPQNIASSVINNMPTFFYYNKNTKYFEYLQLNGISETFNWNTFKITKENLSIEGSYISLCEIRNAWAVTYLTIDDTNDHFVLRYTRSQNKNLSTWSTPIALDTTRDNDAYLKLINNNNRSIIVYHKKTRSFRNAFYYLMCVTSYDDLGEKWARPVRIDEAYLTNDMSIKIINNRIAIAYHDAKINCLKYVTSEDQAGLKWNKPIIVDNHSPKTGINPCLEIYHNLPIISYYNMSKASLTLIYSKDINGILWNYPIIIDPIGKVGLHNCLFYSNQQLWIAYSDQTKNKLKLFQNDMSLDINLLVTQ